MTKAESLERIQKGHEFTENAMAQFSDAERNAPGTLEHWSVKDALAHMTAWQKRWVKWLAPIAEGKPLDEQGPEWVSDDNTMNAKFFAENQHRSWNAVHADNVNALRQIEKLIGILPDDDLQNPQRFPWLEGQPLSRRLENTFYWHLQGHLAQVFMDRGDRARAIQVAEEFSSQVGADEPTHERSVAIYNLACGYSLIGEAEQAIERLRTAFSLDSSLVEWSKQDSDLNPLRENPAFQKLYQ